MNEATITRYKRCSKEYRQYLSAVINDYNSNGKKTVLLTCDAYFPVVDGVVNVIDNYAKELSNLMNVMLLVPEFKGEVYMNGYPCIGVKSGYSKKLQNQVPLPKLGSDHNFYLEKLRIDLIHCHSPFTIGRIALQLHKKRKIPLISTFHSQYKRDFERQAKPLTPFLLDYILKTYQNSDEVWTMHSASRDTLLSYGYEGDIVLMPNATSLLPSADYEAERNIARLKYLKGEDKLLFIFVGRLVATKNILFIVDVLAQLKRRGLQFKMIFAGDGPDKSSLVRKIEKENLADEIMLLGQVERTEIAQIYAAADLLLFPSMYDVSSLVQIESASRYTPTVFAEGSVTSCTVTNGVNGYIFPCDASKFADGVYEAVSDPATLRKISANAYNDLYVNWRQIIERVYERYVALMRDKENEKNEI